MAAETFAGESNMFKAALVSSVDASARMFRTAKTDVMSWRESPTSEATSFASSYCNIVSAIDWTPSVLLERCTTAAEMRSKRTTNMRTASTRETHGGTYSEHLL